MGLIVPGRGGRCTSRGALIARRTDLFCDTLHRLAFDLFRGVEDRFMDCVGLPVRRGQPWLWAESVQITRELAPPGLSLQAVAEARHG